MLKKNVLGNEEISTPGNISVKVLFSQCFNRQKTLNEYCHPKVQKETSNSTEIACQIRRTKRLSNSAHMDRGYRMWQR